MNYTEIRRSKESEFIKHLSNKPCIYMIKSKINGKVYIGQTKNIIDRIVDHYSRLKLNKHCNNHFQNLFNKYSINNFEWKIIIFCEQKDLNSYEIEIIKLYKSANKEFGFNLNDGGKQSAPNINKKGGILENITTGELVNLNCISEFNKKYNVKGNVGDVLRRKSSRCDIWCLPGNRNKFIKKFVDPNGKLVAVLDVKKLAKEVKVSASKLTGIQRGEIEHCRQWRKYNSEKDLVPFQKKIHYFVSPLGKLVGTTSLKDLAKKEKLIACCLSALLKGRLKIHKNGWRKYNNESDLIPYKKEYTFISPEGKMVKTTSLAILAKEINIPAQYLRRVYCGNRKETQGWRSYDKNILLESYKGRFRRRNKDLLSNNKTI